MKLIRIKNIYQNLLASFDGGTNPNPEAPITTPDDSIGPSVGGIGNTTGPKSIKGSWTV